MKISVSSHWPWQGACESWDVYFVLHQHTLLTRIINLESVH